jgi:hypothetical protein
MAASSSSPLSRGNIVGCQRLGTHQQTTGYYLKSGLRMPGQHGLMKRGIGRAVALALGKAGCKVVVSYAQSGVEAEQVCSEVKSSIPPDRIQQCIMELLVFFFPSNFVKQKHGTIER